MIFACSAEGSFVCPYFSRWCKRRHRRQQRWMIVWGGSFTGDVFVFEINRKWRRERERERERDGAGVAFCLNGRRRLKQLISAATSTAPLSWPSRWWWPSDATTSPLRKNCQQKVQWPRRRSLRKSQFYSIEMDNFDVQIETDRKLLNEFDWFCYWTGKRNLIWIKIDRNWNYEIIM